MVGTLDSFRNVGAADTNSFVKLDKKNSKEGAPVYKEFGAGKNSLGQSVRNSKIFSKIYSLVKDPSAAENKRVKQEFIRLFTESYPQFKDRLDGLVKPNSKQPLRAHVVHQLFAEVDKVKPTADFTYNGTVDVRNSHFKNEEHVTKAFETFVGKAGVTDDDGGLLGLLADPSGFIGAKHKEVLVVEQTQFQIDESGEGGDVTRKMLEARNQRINEGIISDRIEDKLKDEFRQYPGVHDLKLMVNRNSNMPAFVFLTDSHNKGFVSETKIDIANLLSHVPYSAERYISGALRSAITEVKTFKDIADLQMLLMEGVKANDREGVAKIGRDIVAAMQSMSGAIDAMLNILLDPKVRDVTIQEASSRLKQSDPKASSESLQRRATANVDNLMRGLNVIRNAMQNPDRGFHGILALGIVAAGNPEHVIEKLRREPVQDDRAQNGGGPVHLNVHELPLNTLDDNDLVLDDLENNGGDGLVHVVLNPEPRRSTIGTDD